MTALPSVTVIMPIRNEAAFIERSLGAVLGQDYPPALLQVLVVDGLSDDGTRGLVERLQTQHPAHRVGLLDNPKRIAPTAMNIALDHADGDVIIRVDGHCEIAPDYVRRCIETLRRTDAECVGGALTTVGETTVARAIALAQSSVFGVGGVAFRTKPDKGCYVDTLAFGAYRRAVFKRLGGFDEELARNQDDEFNFRLTQAGGKIWLDPAIHAWYYSRAHFAKLWRQYYQYGFYKVRVIQKRRAVPSWRHLVPAAFVLGLVFTLILAVLTRQGWVALAVAGPYFVVNLAAALWTGRKALRALPLLVPAFLVLHLAYGLGFLAGLWRWRFHWRVRPAISEKAP